MGLHEQKISNQGKTDYLGVIQLPELLKLTKHDQNTTEFEKKKEWYHAVQQPIDDPNRYWLGKPEFLDCSQKDCLLLLSLLIYTLKASVRISGNRQDSDEMWRLLLVPFPSSGDTQLFFIRFVVLCGKPKSKL